MVKRGHLDVPVVGVAKAGWNLDQLRARAYDSLEKHGGVDPAAFEKLTGLLRYVDGDYQDPATFAALRKELKDAHRPAHYLAIPPVLFETVVKQLAESNCAKGARVIVEKPFGHDLASAQDLNKVLLGVFNEADIFRIDHYLGKRSVNNMLVFRYGKFDDRIYSELASDHPIDLCRYQVANCYMGRAGLINSGGASGKNDLREAVITAVINKRAGGTGLISGRKAFQRPVKEGIELLNAIQDVYLAREVTIA